MGEGKVRSSLPWLRIWVWMRSYSMKTLPKASKGIGGNAWTCSGVGQNTGHFGNLPKRAVTKESKLQVELAGLNYLYPRIYGLGGVMSRLVEDCTRGPGETKLEILKRVIRGRIRKLEKELKEAEARRVTTSKQEFVIPCKYLLWVTPMLVSPHCLTPFRKRQSLVTLMIKFLPRWTLDTDGFLTWKATSNLGRHCWFCQFHAWKVLDAFKSTLEVIRYSDLILHVIDLSSPIMDEQERTVMRILEELGAGDRPWLRCITS